MNAQGGKGKGVAFTVEDFLPQRKRSVENAVPREQTPEQQALILSAFAAGFSGKGN